MDRSFRCHQTRRRLLRRRPPQKGSFRERKLPSFERLHEKNGKELSPVLFWIHGGGFVFGSGNEDLYGPEFLITEDVVLVTINYRLGLLGFVSFDDPSLDIPGNAGLKDQVMALKWVQKNIDKFGGDPNNVTIFGESAGGASVHLLMLSPMGKGLFHKGIAHSGCVLNPWVDGTKGTALLAKAMDLVGSDETTIYNTLMQKSVDEIYEIQKAIGDEGIPSIRRPFGLVVETNSKEPFLDKEPMEVMRSGNFHPVPLIIGYTSSEGMIFEFHRDPNQDMLPIEDVIPWFYHCEVGTPKTRTLVDKIKNFYFEGEDYSDKFLSKKYDLFSDSQFVHGIYVTVRSHLAVLSTPIYLYQMSVETSLNFLKKYLKIEAPGACHCDDVGYLFKTFATPEIQPGTTEDVSIRRFVKLWTNFAKFGNPTPEKNDGLLKVEWKPVTGDNFDFLDIGQELSFNSSCIPERVLFWEKIYSESPAGQASK
ncbi:juvenile hormone esterase-like isoform X2 [Zophobas morio]|uniref:juvenile hormone esterase-like isoform X2 n=1 Tax=Zophobas morio TaxID=2755281 RepID=UPI00308320F1